MYLDYSKVHIQAISSHIWIYFCILLIITLYYDYFYGIIIAADKSRRLQHGLTGPSCFTRNLKGAGDDDRRNEGQEKRIRLY